MLQSRITCWINWTYDLRQKTLTHIQRKEDDFYRSIFFIGVLIVLPWFPLFFFIIFHILNKYTITSLIHIMTNVECGYLMVSANVGIQIISDMICVDWWRLPIVTIPLSENVMYNATAGIINTIKIILEFFWLFIEDTEEDIAILIKFIEENTAIEVLDFIGYIKAKIVATIDIKTIWLVLQYVIEHLIKFLATVILLIWLFIFTVLDMLFGDVPLLLIWSVLRSTRIIMYPILEIILLLLVSLRHILCIIEYLRGVNNHRKQGAK